MLFHIAQNLLWSLVHDTWSCCTRHLVVMIYGDSNIYCNDVDDNCGDQVMVIMIVVVVVGVIMIEFLYNTHGSIYLNKHRNAANKLPFNDRNMVDLKVSYNNSFFT